MTGHEASRGSVGNARVGSSGKLSFSGASRWGTPLACSGLDCWQGLPALSESSLAGVPIGGAAIDWPRAPHMGAAANAEDAQPSDNTNAVRVHRRTIHGCRV